MSEQAVEAVEAAPQEAQEAQEAPQAAPEGIQNPDAYEKALKTEREARKALEGQLKQLQAAEEERARAAMSEQERAIAEAKAAGRAEAQAEYQATLLKARVEAKATGMNFHDPDLVMGLLELDPSADDADIEASLKAIAESRPYLVKQAVPNLPQGPRGDGGPGVSPAKSGDDWIRQMVDARRQ